MEAQLGLFLRIWSDDIVGDASGELKQRCTDVLQAHKRAWTGVASLLKHNLCLVQHFTSIQ